MNPSLYAPLFGGRAYYSKIRSLFGSALISYLPFDDPSGSTARDASNQSRTGALGGATPPTFGAAGIGDGKTAVSVPAATAFINWYSAGLAAAFDPDEGTFMCWGKVSGVAVWSSASTQYMVALMADASNQVRILHPGTWNDSLSHLPHRPAGPAVPTSSPWPRPSGFTWAGRGQLPAAIRACTTTACRSHPIKPRPECGQAHSPTPKPASEPTTPPPPRRGPAAWRTPYCLTARAQPQKSTPSTPWPPTPNACAVLGDSIPASGSSVVRWTNYLPDQWNGGRVSLFNHAVAAHSIMANMDAQTVAAASDNADVIIVALGTNDADNPAINAEYEENLNELKASNPRAMIYAMGILDKTVAGDRVAVNVRIAAAAAAAGCTYWDTTGWIVPATDTSDGLHPNAAGVAKIVTQILALL